MQIRAAETDTSGVVNVNIIYDGNINHNHLPSSFSDNVYTQSCESKTAVNLYSENISDNAVHILTFGLCNNTTVEELNMSNNNITDEGAVAIIDCLKDNKALKKLYLSQNRISFSGMNKMLENIEKQGTTLSLQYVDLSKNQASPWGVYCAIIRHCSVNSLTLCGNERMMEYIKEIADSLQANTTLQSLKLFYIGENELQLIQNAVSSLNKTITESKSEIIENLQYYSPNTSYSSSRNTVFVSINISTVSYS